MIKYNNNDLKSRFITDSTGAVKEVKSVYVGSNKVWESGVAPFFVKWIDSLGNKGEINGSGELNGENFGKQGIAVTVEIGTLCTSIANTTFAPRSYYTPPLKDITISSSVVNIGDKIFNGCPNLEHITIDNNNTVYDSHNNCNAIIKTSTNELICGCKNSIIPGDVISVGDYAFFGCGLTLITIPDSVTTIGNSAFQSCKLSSVTIGNSVTSIGNGVFQGCSGLMGIDIPNSVTSIGERAFAYCSGLTSVTIGSSVTSIGVSAFTSCSGLTSITIGKLTPPTLGNGAFVNTNNCPIYVDGASVNAYKTAPNWSTYADRIQAMPTAGGGEN